MKYLSFMIFSLFLTTNLLGAEECGHYIGSCDYYLCREMKKPCGAKGYFLNFAYKYCSKSFDSLANKISYEGKSWIEQTSTCLQEQLDEVDDSSSCAEIKMKATRSHNVCYVKSHFCSLSLSDKLQILKMLSLSIINKGVFLEGLKVFNQCLHE